MSREYGGSKNDDQYVLATAAIGLKTKQKKAFTTLLAEGNTTDT